MLKCPAGRCSWERLQRDGYRWCYFLPSNSETGLYCAYFSSEGLKGTGKYYVSPSFFQEKRFPLLLLPWRSLPCATGAAAAEIQPRHRRGKSGFVHGRWRRRRCESKTLTFVGVLCSRPVRPNTYCRYGTEGTLNVFVRFAVTLMETRSILKAITRSSVLFILWLQG